jgi:hypothetical protein
MSTIFEALQNAEYNLNKPFTVPFARMQLHNAVMLIDKGYVVRENSTTGRLN